MVPTEKTAKASEEKQGISAPAITLPKGGGAIHGMGEKFAANPVNGTGSMSVPIATSPGRSGFDPQLSLAYDSGAGNGPFGFGWSLSLPSITRKTDKGLPKYLDADESDVFILSGAEDLVPVLVEFGGQWQREILPPRTVGGKTYRIQRYRPRIEGLFARIERWSNEADPKDTFWRSISKDNITTFYGKTAESRITDPADPTRIFSWLICQSYDDKGNAIVYQYVEENSDGVDFSQVHEKNRTLSSRSANRHLKRIHYGNRQPNRDAEWNATDPALLPDSTWMFEVVFDYGDHDLENPLPQEPGRQWPVRNDPFSSYRSGFEVRTYRLCQRVLMFHHFPGEDGVGQDCLVRSTDFTYSHEEDPTSAQNPIFSFLVSVTQSGYKRQPGSYLKKSLPPVEFEYTQPTIDETLREIEPESLENLPYGLDGGRYQWVDLDGEGISGVLTEQAESWFYKRNLSPTNTRQENGRETVAPRFAPVELVAQKPSLATLGDGGQQLLDLAGDGQVDLVELEGPTPGFYERTEDERWEGFIPFTSLPNLGWDNPNLKFIDLTGDGHADILISEDEVFCWHASLAEAGFAPAERVRKALDEEKGPKLVLADGSQSIYLSDMSGDGLTDLVRIRNGEVCYWPNLGYGRFGAKVTMDNAPWFDRPDIFDEGRIRLADIDGSGVTDILYLGHRGVQVYFNQSGNRWSAPTHLTGVPATNNIKSVTVIDLLGNGTACLVWSSPLSGDARQPMRYLDLMGGQKPHLLIKEVNNLGAETHVQYAPSTKFYLADKIAGKPWITRLPFPVHVVERVETLDRISGNRFVTRYAYHHGYFDGPEREFRGFGMVEQLDTEEFAAFTESGTLPEATNIDEASHVPPVLTRTWFHTGLYLGRDHVSNFFAGLLDERDVGEYYREPDLTDEQARQLLLDDTVLPDGLTTEEEREACRALKGSMLRQEVYALDGTEEEKYPYTVTEQNFTIRLLQPHDGNRHAVFFTHAREAISYHYERALVPVLNGQIVDEVTASTNPSVKRLPDPRLAHTLTLEVDNFGNVLRSAAIGYGRRFSDLRLPSQPDRDKQTRTLVTYTENRVTNPIDDVAVHPDDYRTPLPAQTRTYELTGFKPANNSARFSFKEWTRNDFELVASAVEIPYEQTADGISKQKRLIEHVRTFYRPDDLGTAQNNDPLALLSLGIVEPLALPGESYKLAFTSELLTNVYQRPLGVIQPPGSPPPENLLPNPADVLKGGGAKNGGYVDLDGDANWWIPSGRMFFSPDTVDTASDELAFAREHFFLPHRYRDPFHAEPFDTETIVTFDDYKLLTVETRDALGNTARAENDYRVLGPRLVTDPNGNRSEAAFDVLGMVVATAVKGKIGQALGDLLEVFDPDPPLATLQAFVADPREQSASLLGKATTRTVYDLDRYQRCGQPPFAATLARETHFFDPGGPETNIQVGFSYSDGFGREIQKKIQADSGKAPKRGPDVTLPSGDVQPGELVRDAEGEGKPVQADTPQRWVGSGRTVFNNKGKPVRQYEPFFSSTPLYEQEREMTDTGVSPILFYDPVERVVATLHPNHTWEKVTFDPWRQETWDVNDTALIADPKADADVGDFFRRLPDEDYLPTWYQERISKPPEDSERQAAEKTTVHAGTPSVAHTDSLGRAFLTIAHNRFERDDVLNEEKYATRVMLDIEGNQREVTDARDRVVMRYDYDLLGNRIHQASMEAGERWMLNDVTGNPLHAWNSRKYNLRTEYDALRRPEKSFVQGGDPSEPNAEVFTQEILFGKTIYGESPETGLTEGERQRVNLRGKVFRQFDAAGIVTNYGTNPATTEPEPEAYDFKGNLLRSQRQLAREYKATLDWLIPANVPLETEVYTSSSRYDALNRPTELTSPHTQTMQSSVYRPTFNEANLLEKVEVNLRGATTATPFVRNIDYNAKGQRTLIEYGSGATPNRQGVTTTYQYDEQTFRLTRLTTTRPAGLNGIATQLFKDAGTVQDLNYTYDPAGNITCIADDALPTLFFDNQTVDPVCLYTYDAVYRLIEAQGRESIGQSALHLGLPQATYRDFPFAGLGAQSSDPKAVRRYTEEFIYDAVGNFEHMNHRAQGGEWVRDYQYKADSLIEQGQFSNRLSHTVLHPNGNQPLPEQHTHDAHGNMTTMRHLTLMQWDFKDQLRATARQVTNNGTPETTYYVYDAAGQRVRKVTERQATAGATPTRMKERVYLGGFEIYREYGGDGTGVSLERESLHVMDDQQRIALVETRTDTPVPEQLIRYQLGNHLGSASLELDDAGQLISYEEYHPYGSTSYQAGRSAAEVSLKRYRYTGKERDEETGFSYHGARYYAAWLGRWVSVDPAGFIDSLGLYSFAQNNPVNLRDVTGTNSREGTLVEYGAGLGQGHKLEQLHFFPESIQKKINPGWTRPLSKKNKELVLLGSASLNRTVDRKLAKYAEGIDYIRDEKHLLKIIHDIQDIWIEAGVSQDTVRDWAKSSYSTARKIGITKKPVPTRSSVLRRRSGGDVSDATKPKSGLLGKVAKPLAIIQGIAVAGDALADVFKGDFRKAAGKISSYAYDQSIGTVVDTAGAVKDVAEFVMDPLAGIRATVDDIKKMQAEQDALIADIFAPDEQKAPPVSSVVVDRPASKKPAYRRTPQDFAYAVLLLNAYLNIALSEPTNESSPVEESATKSQLSKVGGTNFTPTHPLCAYWTPTGIPFNVPEPCF
ncbi:SpvB/TcaC N-terminal domain-containing protein [Methylobacter sp. YRD-M1]|uniref:SpvB/TcaC N-terminal domain-containing protein n=1 Tax=Methylobacter sp. YRD-M1 TaxID=2911520 RepID=UPI00227A8A5E|nr:SpvB/TcaC N-terminal domain-containing protein [Methylobacter sp. YRD-M1]WAK00594.1 hypothetical protein LZ558_12110 [Methylobacter sp. YRD-M1]